MVLEDIVPPNTLTPDAGEALPPEQCLAGMQEGKGNGLFRQMCGVVAAALRALGIKAHRG